MQRYDSFSKYEKSIGICFWFFCFTPPIIIHFLFILPNKPKRTLQRYN